MVGGGGGEVGGEVRGEGRGRGRGRDVEQEAHLGCTCAHALTSVYL